MQSFVRSATLLAARKNIDMESAKYDMEEQRAVRTSYAQQNVGIDDNHDIGIRAVWI